MHKVERCYVNDYCIGCASCVRVAPACFDKRGATASVIRQPDTVALLHDVLEAQAICPVGAVVVDVWMEERRLIDRP